MLIFAKTLVVTRYSILFVFFVITSSAYSQTFFDFYFKSKAVDGGIVIYNETDNAWVFNNEYDVKKGTPPAATFHLFHTLLGLELGLLQKNDEEYETWDGLPRYYFNDVRPQWSCHTNLDEALLFQTDWYFDRLTPKISNNDYHYFFNRANYSNAIIDRKINSFWNFSKLLVTPEQQIAFLRKLYHKELPFREDHQTYVWNQLYKEQQNGYTIYGYKAYTVYEGQATDWWIGMMEVSGKRYFFSIRLYQSLDNLVDTTAFKRLKYEIAFEVFRMLKMIS